MLLEASELIPFNKRPRVQGASEAPAVATAPAAAATAASDAPAMSTGPEEVLPPGAGGATGYELAMVQRHREEVERRRISGAALTALPRYVNDGGQEVHRTDAQRRAMRAEEAEERRAGLRPKRGRRGR